METGRPEFGPPEGAEELVAVTDIMAQAFAMSPADSVTWVEKVGAANLRVLRQQVSRAKAQHGQYSHRYEFSPHHHDKCRY